MNHKLIRFPNGTDGCLNCGVSLSSRRYKDPCVALDDKGYVRNVKGMYRWDTTISFKNFTDKYIKEI